MSKQLTIYSKNTGFFEESSDYNPCINIEELRVEVYKFSDVLHYLRSGTIKSIFWEREFEGVPSVEMQLVEKLILESYTKHPSTPFYYEKTHAEQQYLTLCRELLSHEKIRGDRTGVGTLSEFGKKLLFDLRDGFPLLTTKKVYWKAVVEELLWFIRGDTNAKHLSEKGVKIWDGNTTRDFLDKRGLDYPEGEAGPIYSHQWRHFGGDYPSTEENPGVDQLKEIIEMIKTDPTSRRLIVSAWNPKDLPKMALPPCHSFFQFYVDEGELSCQMYQRSCDVGLGLPFNIGSYALLTHMIAAVTGLKVGKLIMILGDTHIYSTHREALTEQIKREPLPFPKLSFSRIPETLFEFTADDIVLDGYLTHASVKMEMAV
jgi:thymidylate synthase